MGMGWMKGVVVGEGAMKSQHCRYIMYGSCEYETVFCGYDVNAGCLKNVVIFTGALGDLSRMGGWMDRHNSDG